MNRALFKEIRVRHDRVDGYALAPGVELITRTADSLAGGSNMTSVVERTGIEPVTSGLQSRRSPS